MCFCLANILFVYLKKKKKTNGCCEQLDRDSLVASLKFLRYNEREFRRCAASNGNKLASLKQELDKLSFANNAYQDRSIISYPSEQKINVHVRIYKYNRRVNLFSGFKLSSAINLFCILFIYLFGLKDS